MSRIVPGIGCETRVPQEIRLAQTCSWHLRVFIMTWGIAESWVACDDQDAFTPKAVRVLMPEVP